jgi:hypothetical protein
MKKIISLLLSFMLMFVSMQVVVAEDGSIAKALVLKGKVFYVLGEQDPVEMKEGDSVPVGAKLKTEEKSYTKILFIDKSSLTVGPNTQVVITAFPKEQAGIITLIKGQIRSRVTKDYMNIENKNQSKLFIKTKTAALGIRGTDFQVNYNEENQNSSLITFEGKVAMASFEKSDRGSDFDQVKLEELVSSSQAVMVESGHVSAVNNNLSNRAMSPTLLSSKQINALKNFEYGDNKIQDKQEEKQYRSPIPPGADGATFSNVSASDQSSAKGFFNSRTGEYKLPAGSILDLKTVNIIPPPVNAIFDSNTKSYIVPDDFGKIDGRTGEYKPPKGLELESNGKFKVISTEIKARVQEVKREEKKEEEKKAEEVSSSKLSPENNKVDVDDIVSLVVDEERPEVKTEEKNEVKPGIKPNEVIKNESVNRELASIEAAAPVIDPKTINLPKIYEGYQISEFANRFADATLRSTVVAPEALGTVKITESLTNVVADRKISTETVRQTETDQGILLVPTKVNFKLNVK